MRGLTKYHELPIWSQTLMAKCKMKDTPYYKDLMIKLWLDGTVDIERIMKS